MLYREFPISDILSNYIQTVWAMESETDDEIYPRTLIMPDGIVEIIFHYGSPCITYQDNKRLLQAENAAVSMMRKHLEFESAGKTGFIAVRFYPWGAYHFFNEPVRHFLDDTIDASKLWGSDSADMIKEIKTAATLEDRVTLLEQFLLRMLSKFQKDETTIDEAIKLIRDTKGILSLDEVCSKAGISRKQLERKFLSLVGTTPKIFSRVCRFLNICKHLDQQKGKTLTQLAYECGYYDQSHFINEFKEFSGFTPKDFFAKENIWFTQV